MNVLYLRNWILPASQSQRFEARELASGWTSQYQGCWLWYGFFASGRAVVGNKLWVSFSLPVIAMNQCGTCRSPHYACPEVIRVKTCLRQLWIKFMLVSCYRVNTMMGEKLMCGVVVSSCMPCWWWVLRAVRVRVHCYFRVSTARVHFHSMMITCEFCWRRSREEISTYLHTYLLEHNSFSREWSMLTPRRDSL